MITRRKKINGLNRTFAFLCLLCLCVSPLASAHAEDKKHSGREKSQQDRPHRGDAEQRGEGARRGGERERHGERDSRGHQLERHMLELRREIGKAMESGDRERAEKLMREMREHHGERERHEKEHGERERHEREHGERERHEREHGERERHEKEHGEHERHEREHEGRHGGDRVDHLERQLNEMMRRMQAMRHAISELHQEIGRLRGEREHPGKREHGDAERNRRGR